jgi:hypothetical protein
MSRRPKVPDSVETAVLVRAVRRCCLCFGLNFKFDVVPVQVAHIDRHAANNDPDNLVALCLPHHDEYDSTRRQTKRLTPSEVRHYRSELDAGLAEARAQLAALTSSPEVLTGIVMSDASVADERSVSESYDRERTLMDGSRGRPNGIALKTAALRALRETGHFQITEVAASRLLSLAGRWDALGYVPEASAGSGAGASPFRAISEVLTLTAQTDKYLLHSLLRRLRFEAIFGYDALDALDGATAIPDARCLPLLLSLVEIASNPTIRDDARITVSNWLARLMLSVSFLQVAHTESPETYPLADGPLTSPKTTDILTGLKQRLGQLWRPLRPVISTQLAFDPMVHIGNCGVDADSTLTGALAVTVARAWMTLPHHAFLLFQVGDQASVDACLTEATRLAEIGRRASEALVREIFN